MLKAFDFHTSRRQLLRNPLENVPEDQLCENWIRQDLLEPSLGFLFSLGIIFSVKKAR
jgi:hypothetical protein